MKHTLKFISFITLAIFGVINQFHTYVFFIGIVFLMKMFLFYFFDTIKILNRKIDNE